MNRLEECRELLTIVGRKPFLIAFDLDYTLWPIYCFEETNPPYVLYKEDTKGASVQCYYKRSKQSRIVSLFSDVLEIISLCKDHNITLTICSKSPVLSAGKGILEAIGIWEWFWNPQIFSRSKVVHMRNLVKSSEGVGYEDILFFDDDPINITECGRLGVTCYNVDARSGLNWNSFHQGLIRHKNKTSSVSITRFFQPKDTRKKMVEIEMGEDDDEEDRNNEDFELYK